MNLFSCRDVSRHASDDLDGGLSTIERLTGRLHRVFCANCRLYREQLATTVEAARSAETSKLSASSQAALLDKFRRRG